MIKATVEEVRDAYLALSRMFDEVKLGRDATWRVSRLLGQLKPVAKGFERSQAKLYLDMGGQKTAQGVVLSGIDRNEGESDAGWTERKNAFREKVNTLHDDVDGLLAQEVEINYDPIPLSMLPKKSKGERGEEVDVEYRATDLAAAGQFIVDDTKKE